MPDYVCGAAYEMSVSQLEMMDQFELQYRRELHQCVDLHTGETRECWVYIAETTNDCLLPSKEYLGRVLEGRDILPPEYIQGIESTQTNPQRSPRQEKRLRKEL
ncbi:hypothetical protein AGDE_12166 [Angomonas deanei]|uniref:Gamma-glutamyl cyclotransferase, AIG2-like/AIG2-like family, putative n=1 Tax=Angomonas deanei TaxID=59799 RepID=A0A7G2CB62_9TRYP|nr:hypothetical protein AGDE_12166 [Angomonas deanei]CAD2215272.1 Gamma-glutamyl cyclotransferase, AIG2-like/AIG2-like family, putative [Angomonas deanei]|eukprot:EPY24799.1 hypothetical protein AGDE_12166 [Angomonas deanei]